MIFIKKMNFKLTVLGFLLIILLIMVNGVLMEFGLSKSIEVTCNEHYQEADKNIRTNIELLKDVVKNLSIIIFCLKV